MQNLQGLGLGTKETDSMLEPDTQSIGRLWQDSYGPRMGSFEISLVEQPRQSHLIWGPPPQGFCAGCQVYSEPSSG